MSGEAIAIALNGEARTVAAGTTVLDVVEGLVSGGRGCAVARNGEVVPRGEWHRTALEESDRLEVLTAVPGG